MRKSNTFRSIIIALAAAAVLAGSVVMLTGCGNISAAELKVTEDLESMRYVELDPEVDAEIEGMLSEDGKEYYEMFLGKAGEFDYEITETSETEDATTVRVRITTYDFASEYLRSWTEFLAGTEDQPGSGDTVYDTAALYENLFKNLSSIRKKEYIAYADIKCTQDENGDWQTDARSNEALIDAILGGMVSEMRNLAGIGQ